MARTFFFRMVLRKFSEIANNKPIFNQYNIFYNYEFFFLSLRFDFFSIIAKEANKIRSNVVCFRLPCFVLLYTQYGPLQCFSTYFRKLKEIEVLRPIFPDCYSLWLWYELLSKHLLQQKQDHGDWKKPLSKDKKCLLINTSNKKH